MREAWGGGYILIFEGAYYRRQAQWCTDQRYASQTHLLDQLSLVRVEAPQPQHGKNTPADNCMALTEGRGARVLMLSHSELQILVQIK